MPSRTVTVATAVLCVLAGATDQTRASQTQTPTFRSGLTVIPLDVRVVDRKGASVSDLEKDDFVVLEDGVKQDITHFERRVLTPAAAEALGDRSTLAPFALNLGTRRIFYIELGRMWLGEFRFGLPEALAKFLRERLMPQDYAVVESFGRVTDLTTDHEALAQVVERLAALHKSVDRRRGNARAEDSMALQAWRQQPANSPMRQALDAAFAPASASLRLALRPSAEFATLLDRFESGFISLMVGIPTASVQSSPPPCGGRTCSCCLVRCSTCVSSRARST